MSSTSNLRVKPCEERHAPGQCIGISPAAWAARLMRLSAREMGRTRRPYMTSCRASRAMLAARRCMLRHATGGLRMMVVVMSERTRTYTQRGPP